MDLRGAATPSKRSIFRLALYAGFGLVVVLWVGSSYDTLRQIDDVRGRTEQVQKWFSSTELLLDDVRTGILEGTIDLRDALLDTSTRSNDAYRQRLRVERATVDGALDRYEPHAHSQTERDDLNDLRRTVSDFWSAADAILDLDESGRTPEALRAIRMRIAPRREAVRRISERIGRLNDSAAEDLRTAVESTHAAAKRRTWAGAGLSLFLSIGVAFVVTRHASRLERQIRAETAKNAESVRLLRRLSEQLVQAQEAERRRIARELHDDVGQTLTALKMELTRQVGARPEIGEGLEDARRMADQTLNNVRALSKVLHPLVLEELGLAAALEWYLDEFSKRTGLAADFAHAGLTDRLSPELETCVYRVVQEATTNVARHAAATICRVTLQHDHGAILLIVDDNGRGCEPAETRKEGAPRGLGLVSIEERVAAFGGKTRFESTPGKGTTLTVELRAIDARQDPVAVS